MGFGIVGEVIPLKRQAMKTSESAGVPKSGVNGTDGADGGSEFLPRQSGQLVSGAGRLDFFEPEEAIGAIRT